MHTFIKSDVHRLYDAHSIPVNAFLNLYRSLLFVRWCRCCIIHYLNLLRHPSLVLLTVCSMWLLNSYVCNITKKFYFMNVFATSILLTQSTLQWPNKGRATAICSQFYFWTIPIITNLNDICVYSAGDFNWFRQMIPERCPIYAMQIHNTNINLYPF